MVDSWWWYDAARNQEDLQNWKWLEKTEFVAQENAVNSQHELERIKYDNEGTVPRILINGCIYHEFRKVNPKENVKTEPINLEDI